ncbi:unnamed protein product [Paramecium sonneborni]|uniref:Alpha-type protein kinase domain-containing protein n=1 Tax=Paramecium sonneborni TaxID=65129 RepID=A0A8S1R3U4_9CILI|nr:unnamed protein product [Paramecium sonneborni]
MIQDKFDFENLCIDSIFCSKELCQLNHFRVFVGVCIDYLRIEQKFINDGGDPDDLLEKKCHNIDCKLWHFNNEKLQDQLQKQPVNGVFPFNLCPKGCNQQDCKLLHREWAQNICVNFIFNKCRNQEKCEFQHKNWASLKEEAYGCCQIKATTPELLYYCILYIKGWCPRKQCLKNHIEWEKINRKKGQQNALKSCIILKQEQRKNIKQIPDFEDLELQCLCQSSEFSNYKKWFSQQNIIDVVFIMDLTGSMKPWKDIMEKTIAKIIDKFLKSINGYQIRVAFVGYRDFCDKEKFYLYNFTKKVQQIQDFIFQLETKGGGDEAEDVVTGFEQALKLNFSHHPESLLCTFLLADAPCHGRDYHNIKSDDLINKMPKNYFEKVLEKYKQIKQNNFLCCIKINNKTDIMFQKMKTVFPLIIITTEKKPEDLSDLVSFTLSHSVTESRRLKDLTNKQFLYFKAKYEKFKLDTITDIIEPNKEYWELYNQFVETCVIIGETGLKVTQDKNELNKDNNNSSIYIFKAFDAINNIEIILKLPKVLVDNDGNNNQQQIQNAEEQAKVWFYTSAYACQMAYQFNCQLKQENILDEMLPIFYPHPILYQLNSPFYGVFQIYGETFINFQYNFEQYTSNINQCKPDNYFFSAFSHFSFEQSEKLFVITDLQGCNNLLSNPSIQTSQQWSSILDQNSNNQKELGILNFIQHQHKNCSYLCQKLNLNKLQLNNNLDLNKCSNVQLQHKCGICNLCGEFVYENFDKTLLEQEDQIYEKKKFIFQCDYCLTNRAAPIQLACMCCKKIHIIDYPSKRFKQMQFLNLCLECKQECYGSRKPECHYCKEKCQKLIKTLQINDQTIYVCENAYRYLQAFSCKKCNKPYNMESIISVDDYTQKMFICC